jgi:hypothetical protein
MFTQQRFAVSKWYVLALVAAMTVAVPTTASAATIYKTTFKGDNAYASFESPYDCGYTSAYVVAINGENKDNITGHTSPSSAELSVARIDYCSGESTSGFGRVDLASGQFTSDLKAGSATLSTTIPVTDYYSGGLVGNFSVDITWTATAGPITSKMSNRYTEADGSKFTYTSNGTSRPAIASGTVSADGLNFTPELGVGSLNSSKWGIVTITR